MLASNIPLLLMLFRTPTELGLLWEIKDVAHFSRDSELPWVELIGAIASVDLEY